MLNPWISAMTEPGHSPVPTSYMHELSCCDFRVLWITIIIIYYLFICMNNYFCLFVISEDVKFYAYAFRWNECVMLQITILRKITSSEHALCLSKSFSSLSAGRRKCIAPTFIVTDEENENVQHLTNEHLFNICMFMFIYSLYCILLFLVSRINKNLRWDTVCMQ